MLLQLQKLLYMMRAGRRGRRRDGGGPTLPQLGKSYITLSIIAINIAWFIFEIHNGFSSAGLMKSGAEDYNDVVLGGQWWRIVTAMFVHGGYVHILGNILPLAFYGGVEVYVGRLRYLIVYLVSGICANLTELLLGSHQLVGLGASGAIMGVFGTALVMSLHGELPRVSRRRILMWVAILLVVGVSATGMANLAQVAGLLVGALATQLMVYRWTKVLWTLAIGVVTLLATLGLAGTVAYGGTKSIATSVSEVIQDYNQLGSNQDAVSGDIQSAQSGQITVAYSLENLQFDSQVIKQYMEAIPNEKRDAARPMRKVFDKLYQSESALETGVQVLLSNHGKIQEQSLARAEIYIHKSHEIANSIYPLVKPFGVVEYN